MSRAPGWSSPNFDFLAEHDALLVRYAAQAERYFAEDPSTSLDKLRQFIHVLAQRTAALVGAYSPEREDLLSLLHRLRDQGALPREVADLFHSIRKAGNSSVHEGAGTHRDALHGLRMARELGVWFHRSVGGHPDYKPERFVPPPDPRLAEVELREELERLRQAEVAYRTERDQAVGSAEEQARLRARAEAAAKVAYEELGAAMELAEEATGKLAILEQRHREEMSALQAKAVAMSPAEKALVLRSTQTAGEGLELDEADTRKLIDAQLEEAGWEVDTEKLRYSKGTRPAKGRNLAIAEWPTASGPADYVLFVGLTPLAVVEAKRHHKSVQGALASQAHRYARDYTFSADELAPEGGLWEEYKIPFAFATNGRPFLRQVIDASGIWFRDLRRPTNLPRALEGWYTPDGLTKLLKVDVGVAETRLAADTLAALPLRPFQREAIESVERALAQGRREMLLAMATGTGKTITTICLVYRLLKAGRFRRVLFLVDRTSLGEQAYASLQHTKLAGTQTFTQIYDVKTLQDTLPDADTRLHIATVQSMVRRLFPADDSDAVDLPVDLYDCVIIDECHRGYNLDSEMSDAEMSFRSEDDYISKYRRVLDHFDAVKIGLTATPALHTTQIFGPPIYQYSYRQAVVDGWLVDHEPPFRIRTKLSTEGIRFLAGEAVSVYTPGTGKLESHQLPDELNYDIEAFNRQVLTESFNRVVCETLASKIDPSLPGKTIIYCLNDLQHQGGVNHCDMIVRLLKEAFQAKYGSVDDRAIAKITSSIDDAQGALRHFKNERYPTIAVTVDLLTTGVDVPSVDKLVFLRQVRSRILYEQMLGRATRLCSDLYGAGQPKQSFQIFDAVDLYDAIEPFSNMKPVVTRPKLTFQELHHELSTVDELHRQKILDELIAKLQAKLRVLGEDAARTRFEPAAGMSLSGLIATLKRGDPATALAWFAAHPQVLTLLDAQALGEHRRFVVSEHPDELIDIERGYGTGPRPEDYLESFGRFLTENLNTVPALILVTQRPRELTRAHLRELRWALDDAGFSETHLRTAWKEMRQQDIAASVIGFVRQQALGSPLVPYADRVDRALRKLLASRPWTEPQRQWLDRIGRQLKAEIVVGREDLDGPHFRAHGGFARIDKIFDGRVEQVLGELQEAVWEDLEAG
jgi:type I restriction enzyme R subunit